jgi:hypothetical protein
MPYLDKRAKKAAWIAWCQAEVDTLTAESGAGSIADMIVKLNAAQATVDTITAVAVGSRTARLHADLAGSRAEVVAWRGRIDDARRWVKLARLTLALDGSALRPQDITGSDG